jgi:hypothetical protein
MKINLSKNQYMNLIKLINIGNWVINSIRNKDEIIKDFEELEQHIYSYHTSADYNGIEYDENLKSFFPSEELLSELEVYIQDYDNEIFWNELISRMVEKELLENYTEEELENMNDKEFYDVKFKLMDKYEDEFEKYGIKRLKINNEE